MKKQFFCVLLAFLLLCSMYGCGTAQTETPSVPLSEVMQKMRSEVELPEMLDLTSENLPDFLGIDAGWVSDFAVCVNANGFEKEEIVLLCASDETTVEPIRNALNTSLQNAATEMQNYLPEQYTMIQNSTVSVNGLYITLFISENSALLQQIWDSYGVQ